MPSFLKATHYSKTGKMMISEDNQHLSATFHLTSPQILGIISNSGDESTQCFTLSFRLSSFLMVQGQTMQYSSGTNKELIEEISVLKHRIMIFGQSESKRKEIATVSYFLIPFMVAVLLFFGGLASGTCSATSNPLEVRIGSETEFPPYALVDKNGLPSGFSVDLIKAVTNAMGLSIKISTGSWDTVWNSLVSGQLDVLPIVAKLPERQRLVDFSLPHTETYDAFFVRKGEPAIPNIAAARGKEIVVMHSDAAHHELLKRKFEGKLIIVDTIPAGLELISSGKHDAFLCSKLIGTLSIKEHGITGITAGPIIPDYKRAFSFAVKKGDTELLEKLNQGLLIVKASGEYNLIYDKWLAFDDPWRKVQKYLLPTIIAVIAFAVIAGFWLVMLHLLVRKRTRELAEKNEALCHAYDDMEARVRERTAELSQSNQLLQVDITDRKRAEEALRASEELLRQAVRVSNIGIFDHDQLTDTIYWSPRQREIHGWSPDEPITLSDFLGLVHPEDYEGIVAAVRHAHDPQSDGIWKVEHRIIRRDGTIRWLSERSQTFFDGEGDSRHPVRTVGAVHDVTEQKQAVEDKRNLEVRLQKAEQMEMLGNLAGRVAHDLNNVLGVLSGYSELLTERIPAGNPLREFAVNILKSSGKAAAIVEDLLTLTRRGVRVMEAAKFNNIIVNLIATPEFDKLVAYHPNVIVKTELAKDLLNISGSPVHLEKTILNLVSNAVEAISDSGEVKIKTENRYLDKAIDGYQTVMEGDYVVLTVSDTGKGISASEVKNIFEPFYTKKSMGRSGTGLGLAIVWGTVKDHNGYVDVQSIDGKGSTFTLYFPATREKAEEETQKIPMGQYMGHGESLLVVDDIEEQRQVATVLLKQLGYQVKAVSGGEEAVEYLKSNKVDILVLDMIMEPGIDGLETYQRILEINSHQKAIIVSGFSETDRTREAQKLGAGAYVKKPYLKEKIGVAIRDELDRK